MPEKKIIFSNHAVKQMFQRNISVEDVKFVLLNGIIVNEYPDDRPYPSKLLFAVNNERSLHIVCSENQNENKIIVITAYEPSSDIWENDFVTRKKQ
ncbi:MAG: DUF4258 domain-containing protein [Bacteroidia bacterium]|nr:DUF4258 domain-containing protein [Bacteroidia bacterium]